MMTSALFRCPIFNKLSKLDENLLFSTNLFVFEGLSVDFQKTNINCILLSSPYQLFSFLAYFNNFWILNSFI